MKKTFFAFVISLMCAVAGSQDTVVVFLDDKYSISQKDLATYRREAIVVNGLIIITDTRIDGTMVNYCEYKSLDPRMEHGKAVHYYEDGKIYSTGNYRFGQIYGKWIYYSPEGLADTVYYNYYDDKGDEEIRSEAVEINYANPDFANAVRALTDSLDAFLKADFHLPGRAMIEGKVRFRVNLKCIVDTEGNIRCPAITPSAHPDIDKEILRAFRLFHYPLEIQKPIIIPQVTFSNITMSEADLSDSILVVAEEMPHFPGGDEALMRFIYENIQYPDEAKDMDITGKVIIRFVVTSTGSVENVTVARGAHPLLDAEAVRVVSILPPFIPGKNKGKLVDVWYSLPISFQIKTSVVGR